ncbi:sigma 54-interacting transcriptional regulator [Reinekea sp.]|uniref:sigma-54-dependent Fis family transcriptional regulator n=1 Tax=Reinekea sp. TaxID=1970455 RepID=UPI00257B7E8C|nr:sigma 54-interacting transcriptional regulator [Reinekea sp.]
METAFEKARNALELRGKFAYGAVPEPIADSWRRCIRLGLDPVSKPEECVVSYSDLFQRREKLDLVLRLVRPELELLSAQIAGSNFLVAFADHDGVVLDHILDEEFRTSVCGKSILPGSIWSEDIRGTNALGLALHTGTSCNVTGREHYFAREGSISCLSAPIFDSKGQLIGLLDASSEVAARQHHTLALVNLAAQNVENRLFVDDHRGDYIIQFHPRQEYLQTQNVGMIAFNQEGQITGANRRSSELLTGIILTSTPTYQDVFKGQFRILIDRIGKGEVVQIRDWLQAGYFARLRLTHSANSKLSKTQVFLPADPIYRLHKTTEESTTGRIFTDEALRHNLRLGKKSAQQGMPVMIFGGPGTGKNSIAEEIHEQLHPDENFVLVDCATVNLDSVETQLIAQMKSNSADGALKQDKIDLKQGGTLYLDRVDLLPADMVPSLNTLLNRLLHRRNPLLAQGEWVILSSTQADDSQQHPQGPLGDLCKRLAGFSLYLPKLRNRSDFRLLCCAMLATISPQHSLSSNAVEALKEIAAINNLSDLDWSVRTLAIQHHEGVIRTEGVTRILGQRQLDVAACSGCKGHMVKEVKCLEIRKVMRECNGNVALASRQLGVSRNTVYAHAIG